MRRIDRVNDGTGKTSNYGEFGEMEIEMVMVMVMGPTGLLAEATS